MTRVTALIACTLLLASCRGSGTNVVLSSLERSEKIQLGCANVEQLTGNLYELRPNGIFPLALCDEDTNFASSVDAQSLGSVTQIESGTVAVVNFSNSAIFDTNRTVPGVTALRVGEQPTGIQISPVDARYTYVSSFSPKSVQAISTREVITGTPVSPDGDDEDLLPDEPILEQQQLRFEAGPTDLALHEFATYIVTTEDGEVTGAETTVDYRFLYAAIPELNQVVQIQVNIDNETGEQTWGSITELVLPTYDCDSVTPVPPPASDDTDYNRICPAYFEEVEQGRIIKEVTTTTLCTEGIGTGPAPVALSIDYGDPDDLADDVLLVADANQPVIHRFNVFLNGATPQPPIVTLAPTTDVDVTPHVPASSDGDDRIASQRYLYAVSAIDGSIIAVDYTPSSATFGAVLPVLAGVSSRANEENVESRNRVRSSFANARSIEVIAPFYELESDGAGNLVIPDDDSENDICDPNDADAFSLAQNSDNMRGVFLAVSLSDGTMFFLDVYDLNAPCRGGEGREACTPAYTGSDQFASIRRHRSRIGFTPSTFIAIDGTPSIQFNSIPGAIDEFTGLPLSSDGPSLEFIECPVSQFNVFGIPINNPDPDVDGLICASSQVWSSFTQRWDARWQGLIPHSEGGLGLFADESYQGEAGSWFLAGDVPFCRVGVLGPQSGTPSGTGFSIDELQAYGGDRLVMTGELPPATRDDPDCETFVDLLDDIDDRQVWFPIVRAFNDQLEIGPAPDGARYTLEQVRGCFNQYTEYQIHTRDAYAVVGTTSDFIHRVIPDPSTGECVFDDSRPIDDTEPFDVDTFLTARAFPGTQFINPLVSFQISEFGPDITPVDSTIVLLNFNILNQFGFEVLPTSGGEIRSLPASMLFSSDRDELFFVDYDAGVRRIVFSPLSIVQSFD